VSYSLLILPRAQRGLADLPAQQFSIAELKIEALRENPRPAGCKKLAERQGWRIRFGDYRILYKLMTPTGPSPSQTLATAAKSTVDLSPDICLRLNASKVSPSS